ncbi:MAG: hypothetical protein JRH13_13755 [Deltaproteobacteria bacterium]|nr:hypothetical protein [Deltaproteobacteria bacterium]
MTLQRPLCFVNLVTTIRESRVKRTRERVARAIQSVVGGEVRRVGKVRAYIQLVLAVAAKGGRAAPIFVLAPKASV